MKAVQGESETTLDDPEEDLGMQKKICSQKSEAKKKLEKDEDSENLPIWVF